MYLYLLLLLCLFNDYIFCMEIVSEKSIELTEIKTDQDKKIKSIDVAKVVASYSSQEQSKYTIKSFVIAEVMNKKQLGINESPLDEQIKYIKDLKKNNVNQYTQLISNVFSILSQENTDELSALKRQYYEFAQHESKEKNEKFEQLQKWMTYFDSSEKFWNCGPTCCMLGSIVVPIIVVEAWCLLFFGLISSNCWN